MKRYIAAIVLTACAAGFGAPEDAHAQGLDSNASLAILKDVGIDQRVGEPLPLEATFRDEHGNPVKLGRYFHQGKPVILALVYYECPMLCTEILNGLTRSIRPLSFDVGKEFDIVAVSFDPRETARLASEKKSQYVASYGREGAEAGWHFLTGDSAGIRALTEATGFRYTYDEKVGQFAHASAIMVTTPEGVLSRYYFGIEYPTKDLRLSLVEASANRIGTPIDQVLLYCFHYDPETGKYGLVIMRVIRLAGAATLLAMGAFMWIMFRRDRRANRGES